VWAESFTHIKWDTVLTAVVVVVATILVGWICHKIGHWLLMAIKQSFAQVVVTAMAPEMAHQSKQIASSINEMAAQNTKEHEETGRRLSALEDGLASVQAAIVRSPAERTRVSDRTDKGHPT
jgi:hypothetical protein